MKKQDSVKNDYRETKDKSSYKKVGKKDMKILKGAGIRPAAVHKPK